MGLVARNTYNQYFNAITLFIIILYLYAYILVCANDNKNLYNLLL